MNRLAVTTLAVAASLAAAPALAATGPFFSLFNTDFVVTISFLLFVAVLIYYKVPGLLGSMLDKRAASIQAELDEARKLREEAQSILASYERKHKEVQEMADRIVATARAEAADAAEQAKADLARSIERRLAAAEEQIASAEAAALKEVRNRAVDIAVAAASEVIASHMGAGDQNRLIDAAISTVREKLH